MTPTKLESLPNEVLLEIFEKYINAVDLRIAFDRLNQRFTALIQRTQQLLFDFRRCRKDHFLQSIELLANDTDRMNRLVLSDEHMPKQIDIFLARFDTLAIFQNLRMFSLYFDGDCIDREMVGARLISLTNIRLETLSIRARHRFSLNHSSSIITHLLGIPTLKRFYCDLGIYPPMWELPTNGSSVLEYLTLCDLGNDVSAIEKICRFACRLKYLHVEFRRTRSTIANELGSDLLQLPLMTQLRTFILVLTDESPITVENLAMYFYAMPILHRLTIDMHSIPEDIEQLPTYIEAQLPLLKKLTLSIADLASHRSILRNLLTSFGNHFRVHRPQFRFVIVPTIARRPFSRESREMIEPNLFDRSIEKISGLVQDEYSDAITVIDQFRSLTTRSLRNSAKWSIRFAHATCLYLDGSDANLIKILEDAIDCSAIRQLFVLLGNIEKHQMNHLLALMPNVSKLVMSHRLVEYLNFPLPQVIFLDISVDMIRLGPKEVEHVARLFPSLEHLRIGVNDLSYIPSLGHHFPHLLCLELSKVSYVWTSWCSNMLTDLRRDLHRANHILFDENLTSIRLAIDSKTFNSLLWHKYASIAKPSDSRV